MHNNREAKKQANRRANREGMDTPPREEPQEQKLKSRVTNLWWFENEFEDHRYAAAVGAGEDGEGNEEHGIGEDA